MSQISDHLPVFSSFSVEPLPTVFQTIKFRLQKQTKDISLTIKLSDMNFNEIIENNSNINEKYNSFLQTLLASYSQTHPIKEKTVSAKR